MNKKYLWNTLAGLINASEAVILSIVITRTNGLTDAGILSIAFAIGNLMLSIGKFGVRTFQVTDVNQVFSFSDYFWTRIITCSFMVVTVIIYLSYCVFYKGYDTAKVVVIILMCSIFLTEAIEDVFWGLYQSRDAIEKGARIFAFRWIFTLLGISAVLIAAHNLLLAMIAGLIITILCSALFTIKVFPAFQERIRRAAFPKCRMIIRQCFPLFAVAFMTFYVSNAPKYAIDRYMTAEIQACYGFIAMPVFAIELLNGFIYQPTLVQTATEWNNKEYGSFLKRVKMQCCIIIALTVVCISGAALLGIPVLSLVYNTDLSAYKTELLILLLGGGFLAFVGYFFVILTTMRKQKNIMCGYLFVSIVAFLLSNTFVRNWGVTGAAVLYMVLIFLLSLIFAGMFLYEWKKVTVSHPV
ncbi:MAG: lipopolysaccharide biosynthesis protein [Roseburia sp.]|nr:lipopolysaccharide biosynthesis protein [Roseburia sp.]